MQAWSGRRSRIHGGPPATQRSGVPAMYGLSSSVAGIRFTRNATCIIRRPGAARMSRPSCVAPMGRSENVSVGRRQTSCSFFGCGSCSTCRRSLRIRGAPASTWWSSPGASAENAAIDLVLLARRGDADRWRSIAPGRELHDLVPGPSPGPAGVGAGRGAARRPQARRRPVARAALHAAAPAAHPDGRDRARPHVPRASGVARARQGALLPADDPGRGDDTRRCASA